MISSVYSYYMSTYGNNRLVSKHDSHKKSELKDRYNDILQSNSKAPVCKVDLSEDALKFAIDVKENALSLSNILEDIRDDKGETFKKNAFSSNPDVLEVKYIGEETKENKLLDIGITSLAAPQINKGKYIDPEGKAIRPGKYSFDVDISNVTYEFQFTVNATENNKNVLEKLSRLINKSNVGIVAATNKDESGNEALVISAATTGTSGGKEKVFDIHDDKGEAGAVFALGIDNVSSLAKDAVFTVNGETKTSVSNEFTLGKLYDIKVKATSEEPVHIGLKEDTDSMVDNLNNIVSGYNSVIDLSQTADRPEGGTRKLFRDFVGVANTYKNALASNGLDITDTGHLEVNPIVMEQKSEDGSIIKSLDELKSFSDSLMERADNAVIDPMNYANKIVVAYKNPNHIVNVPYESSAYSGMMFNGYI